MQLTPRLEAKIEELVASGHYADAGDVIDKAVQLLAERERKLARLRAELAIGEEQERRGEVVDLTRERFEEIKRQALWRDQGANRAISS
ncbi:MAG: Bacterial antitoxin of ParD toxin-antitoxin type system [Thermomicrobiales bacterium]|jgi:putative addiction module CopG family antidote|nr:Bacterial antitoxin of ParD toxin-antitoxin type system [Thermomicrobiales bacterium]